MGLTGILTDRGVGVAASTAGDGGPQGSQRPGGLRQSCPAHTKTPLRLPRGLQLTTDSYTCPQDCMLRGRSQGMSSGQPAPRAGCSGMVMGPEKTWRGGPPTSKRGPSASPGDGHLQRPHFPQLRRENPHLRFQDPEGATACSWDGDRSGHRPLMPRCTPAQPDNLVGPDQCPSPVQTQPIHPWGPSPHPNPPVPGQPHPLQTRPGTFFQPRRAAQSLVSTHGWVSPVAAPEWGQHNSEVSLHKTCSCGGPGQHFPRCPQEARGLDKGTLRVLVRWCQRPRGPGLPVERGVLTHHPHTAHYTSCSTRPQFSDSHTGPPTALPRPEGGENEGWRHRAVGSSAGEARQRRPHPSQASSPQADAGPGPRGAPGPQGLQGSTQTSAQAGHSPRWRLRCPARHQHQGSSARPAGTGR